MTDIPTPASSVPARLGVGARLHQGELSLRLTPQPETLHHGIVRASVLAYLVDAASGIPVDDDPAVWTLTTDMSVRVRPEPAPSGITATSSVLRRGRRSITCKVDLDSDEGERVGMGTIGFATVPRRDTDPPKPTFTLEEAAQIFVDLPGLSRPLRDEAGIEVIDAREGVVQVDVTPELRNPAGTLQGAMVALLAEAAAEDLVATRLGGPAVVTDLDLRYLAQAPVGPVRTRCRALGLSPDAPIEVELVDLSAERVTTVAYARAVAV
jgi:acyl-coenzyme A thioesterase PaaI-like protein